MSDAELRQLVMEARKGNTVSYRQLLDWLAPFIRRAGASILHRYGKADLSEDIMQDVLLTIHLKLHTYDMDQPLLAWVRAILRHRIIDVLRRNRIAFSSIDADDFVEPAATDNPEIPMIRRDLHRLLEQLKPPAGDIIYALKVEGMTTKELAQRHQMSESNIKILIHRGLQRLATLIADGKET